MKIVNLKTTIAALALGVALTIPAAGSAHPSMYLIVGKIANKAETQTLTVDATGGTYKPSANAKTIPWNAPSWQVQDALGADGIGRNATTSQANVLVTGNPGGPYTIRFQGSLATTNVAPLAPVSTGLTGRHGDGIVTTVTDGICDEHDLHDRPDRRDPPGHAAAGRHRERRLRHDVDRIERPHRPRLAEPEVRCRAGSGRR